MAESTSDMPFSSADDFAEIQRSVAEATADCMREAGFDVDATLFVEQLDPGDAVVFLDAEDRETFIDEYGYGIVQAQFASFAEPDPANSFAETLSAGEAIAWTDALAGTEDEPGCDQRATEKVLGGGTSLAEIEQSHAERERALAAAPEVIEIESEWTTCMTQHGHNFNNRADAIETIEAELGEFVSTLDPTELLSSDLEENPTLRELFEAERVVARDDADCFAPLQGRYEAVQASYAESEQ